MANDLLKKLEEKINEAIETIELSRMEVSDLKEQNEELENRYADWETRLSTLIEKFEQLEDEENTGAEEIVNTAMQENNENSEEEIEAIEEMNSENLEDEEVEVETSEAFDLADSEIEEDEDSDDQELGSTFDTNTDSFQDAEESSQHYA